jgi:hypothetical protein
MFHALMEKLLMADVMVDRRGMGDVGMANRREIELISSKLTTHEAHTYDTLNNQSGLIYCHLLRGVHNCIELMATLKAIQ